MRHSRCSDSALLVEYPTRQAFLDLIASADYQAIGHLRTEALEHGELHPAERRRPAFNRWYSAEPALYSPGDGRRPERELDAQR